jgi:hypothetical protein
LLLFTFLLLDFVLFLTWLFSFANSLTGCEEIRDEVGAREFAPPGSDALTFSSQSKETKYCKNEEHKYNLVL